jgi:hypothetical protein
MRGSERSLVRAARGCKTRTTCYGRERLDRRHGWRGRKWEDRTMQWQKTLWLSLAIGYGRAGQLPHTSAPLCRLHSMLCAPLAISKSESDLSSLVSRASISSARRANRQKRLRHRYRGSRYACARSAPLQVAVRAKRAPDSRMYVRSAPRGRPMSARASKRQRIKQDGIKRPKILRRARCFACGASRQALAGR